MAVDVVRTKLLTNFILIFTVLLSMMFQIGDYTKLTKSKPLVNINPSLTRTSTATETSYLFIEQSNSSACELIYKDYLNMIQNFTLCELQYASPFRLCINCTELYEMTKAIYLNLTQEPKHVECKIKYMQLDRVQIIPTLQSNIYDIWSKAHCQNCYSYDTRGLESGKVNYRPDVTKFLELHQNFSDCINATGQEQDIIDMWTIDGNKSSACKICGSSYTLLNDHYNSMYSYDCGDVCMDIMYRMNYSRIFWSYRLRCNHREGGRDTLPVIIISCIVACTPILFYVSLKVTGKVGRKKIFKQKRLVGSQTLSGDSPTTTDTISPDTREAKCISKRRNTTAD